MRKDVNWVTYLGGGYVREATVAGLNFSNNPVIRTTALIKVNSKRGYFPENFLKLT